MGIFSVVGGLEGALNQPLWKDLTISNPFLLVVFFVGDLFCFVFFGQIRGQEGALEQPFCKDLTSSKP